jgi:hypothetical protein
MQPLQTDALIIVSAAREYATLTASIRLHLACSQAIEVLLSEGCQVPVDLCLYARQMREVFGEHQTRTSVAEPTSLTCP